MRKQRQRSQTLVSTIRTDKRKWAQTETQEIPFEHKTIQEEEEEKNPTTSYSGGGQALGHIEPPSFGDTQNPSGRGPEQPTVADPALSRI